MKGFNFDEAAARAHAAKHNYELTIISIGDPKTSRRPVVLAADEPATSGHLMPEAQKQAQKRPEDRMNKTERRYANILEAMKRRGDVLEYRYEGISLAWGADPETGKPMWYTPDFYVVKANRICPHCDGSGTDSQGELMASGHRCPWCEGVGVRDAVTSTETLLIEVKGAHIYEKDRIRFKGCRAEWPQFRFELWQWKGGEWTQLA